MNHNQVTATIHETSPRAADWRGVFGRLDNIPLQGPLPQAMRVPEKGEVLAYLLDLASITLDERQRLVAYIAGRFNLSPVEVERDLDQTGCPILSDDLLVTVPASLALAMMDDFDTERDEDDWLEQALHEDQGRPFEEEGFGEDDDDYDII
jgi:hypothetical protein